MELTYSLRASLISYVRKCDVRGPSLDDVVVVVGVVDVAMFFVEVFCVVVTLDVVVVFHDLSTVVFAMVIVMMVVRAAVPRVVRVHVLKGEVHLGADVQSGLRHQFAVSALVVSVVEVTHDRHHHLTLFDGHQNQSLQAVDVRTGQISLQVKLSPHRKPNSR